VATFRTAHCDVRKHHEYADALSAFMGVFMRVRTSKSKGQLSNGLSAEHWQAGKNESSYHTNDECGWSISRLADARHAFRVRLD